MKTLYHKQVKTSLGYSVDKNIKVLVESINSLGFKTLYSCEGVGLNKMFCRPWGIPAYVLVTDTTMREVAELFFYLNIEYTLEEGTFESEYKWLNPYNCGSSVLVSYACESPDKVRVSFPSENLDWVTQHFVEASC